MHCLISATVLIATLIIPLATPTAAQDPTPTTPQIGLNFIRVFWEVESVKPGQRPDPGQQIQEINTLTPYVQPDWILTDFRDLGIHAFRQFIKADLFWDIIEPHDDDWHFEAADAVLLRDDLDITPIVTLFALQYASPTPPWVTEDSQFQKTLGPEAMDYLDHVIERYNDVITYWEIGNEMNHWRAADPDGNDRAAQIGRVPSPAPAGGFSPQEQGVFLAQVAAYIRERDPDAVIVMPGIGGIDDYTLDVWFAGVIQGGGSDWFDVVNYHYYSPWFTYPIRRPTLQQFLVQHNIAHKPVWLTETGSTSSPTLTQRTDYPNSPASQAADMFRRLIQAYGHGDSLVMWHTYIGSPDLPNNLWRLYGIRQDTGQNAAPQPSYYALKLLIGELIPFAAVETLDVNPQGANAYRITTGTGAVKYVAWGSGTFTLPDGVTQMTGVMPGPDGKYGWESVTPGETILLSATPVLVR